MTSHCVVHATFFVVVIRRRGSQRWGRLPAAETENRGGRTGVARASDRRRDEEERLVLRQRLPQARQLFVRGTPSYYASARDPAQARGYPGRAGLSSGTPSLETSATLPLRNTVGVKRTRAGAREPFILLPIPLTFATKGTDRVLHFCTSILRIKSQKHPTRSCETMRDWGAFAPVMRARVHNPCIPSSVSAFPLLAHSRATSNPIIFRRSLACLYLEIRQPVIPRQHPQKNSNATQGLSKIQKTCAALKTQETEGARSTVRLPWAWRATCALQENQYH